MVLQDLFTENLQSDWYRDENDQSWSKTVGKGRRKKNINMATRPEKDGSRSKTKQSYSQIITEICQDGHRVDKLSEKLRLANVIGIKN